MSVYLIGGKVLFDSNDSCMVSVSDISHKVSIGSVAGRCFKVLLDSNGEVVKKRTIIEKAWGSYGLEVTDNSLAQAIRQIRLALKTFDLPDNAVNTIPRIGYTLTVAIEAVPEVAQDIAPVMCGALDNPSSCPVLSHRRSNFEVSKTFVAGVASIIGFGLGALATLTTASA